MAAARGAWICGAVGTSLVAAGRSFGIPLSGTMAHSFVMSYDDERDAFRAYARTFPRAAVLLIDTYDTVEGARRAAEVAHEVAADGIAIDGVRLDSGDLGALAHEVRRVLDDAGLPGIRILASGDLDEHRVAALIAGGAPIDAFGVGTQLGTSGDAPSLGAVYKLVEDADGPKMKLASGKVTLPGRKQVWRLDDHDVLSLHDEQVPGGRPLLTRVMAGGRRTEVETLDRIRARAMATIASLPPALRSLEPAPGPVWSVEVAPALHRLAARVQAGLGSAPAGEATG
jgi:nicotinate phosphoribosyltransferase